MKLNDIVINWKNVKFITKPSKASYEVFWHFEIDDMVFIYDSEYECKQDYETACDYLNDKIKE